MRSSSIEAARKQSFVHFARVLAAHIIELADNQRRLLPRPGSTTEDWAAAGVHDDHLFSEDLTDSFDEDGHDWANIMTWSDLDEIPKFIGAADMITSAICDPANDPLGDGPLEHLPSLIRLAQHPKVQFSNLWQLSGTYLHRACHISLGVYLAPQSADCFFVLFSQIIQV